MEKEIVLSIHRFDGTTLDIHHAAEMAQVFFRLDPSANGSRAYDILVAQANRDRIEESDIHAINGTMAARSPLAVWQELIGQDAPAWLAALAPEWVLLELTDEEWKALGVEPKLADAFRATFGPGRRLSVVTKVLHMKRPDFIPVCDTLVLQQLGTPAGTDGDPEKATGFIGHLRREGRRNLSGLRAIEDRLRRGGQAPSLLRIFEALIWQSHPDVWYQKLAPLVAEWLGDRPAELGGVSQ